MYCSACGTENEHNNYRCTACDAVLVRTLDEGGYAMPDPVNDPQGRGPAPDRLAFSIVVTVLCCWPFGIPAIVYAAKTMSANGTRDYEEAHVMSKKATTWCWVAFGVSCAIWIPYLVILVIAGVAGAAGAGSTP
jgi:hypothetical protein